MTRPGMAWLDARAGWPLLVLVLLVLLTCPGGVLWAQGDSLPPVRTGFVGIPVAFYLPETRLGGGLAGIYYFRQRGAWAQTRISSVQALATYTQNRQPLLKFPVELNWSDSVAANRHIFRGDFTAFRYPLWFWGIGSLAAEAAQEGYTLTNVWVRGEYLRQVWPRRVGRLYAGLRLRWNEARRVALDAPGGLLATGGIAGAGGGRVAGAGVVLSHDSRDNLFVPQSGRFAYAALSAHPRWMGSDFAYTRLELDGRAYFRLHGQQVLAVQAVVQHHWGQVPFEHLALVGGYVMGRGYYEGRYRDRGMAAVQAEYRLPLGWGAWDYSRWELHRRFEVVAFASLADVYAAGPHLGSLGAHVKYAYGLGGRFLASRRERVTLRMDYGWGRDGNSGLYVMIGEAF